MKTKATTATLSLALLLLLAVGARAQEGILAPAGSPYLINSTADASAVNPVSYQWYRNGSPISGATSASYTVPAAQANGSSVEFKRHVSTQGCSGELEGYSNTVTVTFVNLTINGVRWADANVDSYQTFAAKPDMYTKFYQWNKATAYSVNDPITPAWDATTNTSATWTVNPCPTGWRLPTENEFIALHSIGFTWVNANDRGNEVAGMFFGSKHSSCTLPDNMAGCIFIPASGRRRADYSGSHSGSQGVFCALWSSTQYSSSSDGVIMYFNNTPFAYPNYHYSKSDALSVRCVQ